MHKFKEDGMVKRQMIAVFLLVMASISITARGNTLETGFADPLLEARTRCFWWWLEGNVTPEAITRDLEAMKAKGLGGALLFDASSSSHKTV